MGARFWAVIASFRMLRRIEWKIISENNGASIFKALAGPLLKMLDAEYWKSSLLPNVCMLDISRGVTSLKIWVILMV
jgi:hypothetical protein